MAESSGDREPFPAVETGFAAPAQGDSSRPQDRTSHEGRTRYASSAASAITNRLRSLSRDFEHSRPPEGFMAATGELASSVIILADDVKPRKRDASGSSSVPSSERTRGKSGSSTHTFQRSHQGSSSSATGATTSQGVSSDQEGMELGTILSTTSEQVEDDTNRAASDEVTITAPSKRAADATTEEYENGYHFPPSYSWQESFKMGSRAFWHYFLTPIGLVVTLYGLNVVAWGGMLFLLLCNASPAMCHPDCNDINSPRRIWVEIDSQILNALFCVTGFGLAPWRFRDWYYLLQYRLLGKQEGLRRLAGINRGWFRLPGSHQLPTDVGPETLASRRADVPDAVVPIPESSIPPPPLTGVRAQDTKLWKLDFVIWMMVGNTFLQVVLCVFMYKYNRYTRPSWATGLFVAMGCIVAALGGLMMFLEGKTVKGIEGVPLTERDREILARDKELGIPHYNNIKDKKPKEKVSDPESNMSRTETAKKDDRFFNNGVEEQ